MPLVVRVCNGVPVVAIEGADEPKSLLDMAAKLLKLPSEETVIVDLDEAVLTHPLELAQGLAAWQAGGNDIRVVCGRLSARRVLHRADPAARVPVFGSITDALRDRLSIATS
jgi:hypothetical protein